MYGAKERAGAYIDQEHHRQLTLFFKHLAERVAEPRRNVPVNKPNVVACIIFPYFPERHPLSLKGTVVFAREQVAGELLAFDLQLADFFQYFGGGQHKKMTDDR